MLRKELLQDAQEVVASSLLGEGITVVYDARETPHADLTDRVMHLRPLPDEVDDRALMHLRADCDHEMGHFGASDPAVLDAVSRPLVKVILNAIEDGFVERWVSARWLGCAQNLEDSNDELFEEIRAGAAPDVENKRARAVNALMLLARGESLDDAVDAVGPDVRPILEEISDLIPDIQVVANSAKSLELAEKVVDRWRWGNPQTKHPQPKPKPKGDKKRPTPRERAQERRKKKKKPVSADRVQWQKNRRFRENEDRVAEQLKKATVGEKRKQKIAAIRPPKNAYRAYTDEDVVERLYGGDTDPSEFVDGVRGVVPVLRRRLLMEFRGKGSRVQHDMRRGEIDRASLHKVALGSDRIFEQELPAVVVDADVTLLVDCSGSMTFLTDGTDSPSRLHVASQAACAFSLVLDLIGVPHECLAFTTVARYGRARTSIEPRGPYQRVRPLRHLVVKDARQSFRDARGAFAKLSSWEGCAENVDGESVMWAARRLAARNRPGMKPFLIVFSDGFPQSVPEQPQTLSNHLKKTVRRIEESGVTVLGVGIQSDAVARYYRNHVVIGNVSDLVGTSYEIIRATLRAASRLS